VLRVKHPPAFEDQLLELNKLGLQGFAAGGDDGGGDGALPSAGDDRLVDAEVCGDLSAGAVRRPVAGDLGVAFGGVELAAVPLRNHRDPPSGYASARPLGPGWICMRACVARRQCVTTLSHVKQPHVTKARGGRDLIEPVQRPTVLVGAMPADPAALRPLPDPLRRDRVLGLAETVEQPLPRVPVGEVIGLQDDGLRVVDVVLRPRIFGSVSHAAIVAQIRAASRYDAGGSVSLNGGGLGRKRSLSACICNLHIERGDKRLPCRSVTRRVVVVAVPGRCRAEAHVTQVQRLPAYEILDGPPGHADRSVVCVGGQNRHPIESSRPAKPQRRHRAWTLAPSKPNRSRSRCGCQPMTSHQNRTHRLRRSEDAESETVTRSPAAEGSPC